VSYLAPSSSSYTVSFCSQVNSCCVSVDEVVLTRCYTIKLDAKIVWKWERGDLLSRSTILVTFKRKNTIFLPCLHTVWCKYASSLRDNSFNCAQTDFGKLTRIKLAVLFASSFIAQARTLYRFRVIHIICVLFSVLFFFFEAWCADVKIVKRNSLPCWAQSCVEISYC